jgi:hypothetical protein
MPLATLVRLPATYVARSNRVQPAVRFNHEDDEEPETLAQQPARKTPWQEDRMSINGRQAKALRLIQRPTICPGTSIRFFHE